MKITIHRGTGQIGGCVTEYENNGWRLFVDYGEQLPGAPTHDEPLEIEGLTKGDVSKSALLLTHYHGDHIGRIPDLPKTLPIYMGRIARDIQVYASEHLRCLRIPHRGRRPGGVPHRRLPHPRVPQRQIIDTYPEIYR